MNITRPANTVVYIVYYYCFTNVVDVKLQNKCVDPTKEMVILLVLWQYNNNYDRKTINTFVELLSSTSFRTGGFTYLMI
jgi:hypothetical protein